MAGRPGRRSGIDQCDGLRGAVPVGAGRGRAVHPVDARRVARRRIPAPLPRPVRPAVHRLLGAPRARARSGRPTACPPPSSSEILVRSSGGVTQILDRLERAGLVARAPDPDDRRKVVVELTPDGLRTADEANATYMRERERLLARPVERRDRPARRRRHPTARGAHCCASFVNSSATRHDASILARVRFGCPRPQLGRKPMRQRDVSRQFWRAATECRGSVRPLKLLR